MTTFRTLKTTYAASFLALAFAFTPSLAKAAFECPTQLDMTVAIYDDVQNWKLGGDRPTLPLKGARIFIGTIEDKVLRPSSEIKPIPEMDKANNAFLQNWAFDERDTQSKILVCDYFGTNNYLMRTIPPNTRACNAVEILSDENHSIRVKCD